MYERAVVHGPWTVFRTRDLKLVAFVIAAVIVLSAGVFVAGSYYLNHLTPSGRLWSESHISIDGDDELASSDALVSGSGTALDPYVISISDVDFSRGVGVEITNTSAHFQLRDSRIEFHDTNGDCIRSSGLGVRIANAAGFKMLNVSFSNCGLVIDNCTDFEISQTDGFQVGAGFANCSNGLLDGNAFGVGGVSIANCSDLILRNSGSMMAAILADCDDVCISYNVIERCDVVLRGCERCTVSLNTVKSVTFERGTVDSQIRENSVNGGSSETCNGVYLDCAENITVEGNIIENCSWGAGIELGDCVVNCTLVRNNISRCYGGISLRQASGCLVYHNNIMSSFWSGGWMLEDPQDCQRHGGAIIDTQGWLNSWDIGYPGGGNYYFDYNGTDMYGGPSQDIQGADGYGDAPFQVYSYSNGERAMDHYPLMAPYPG